MSSADFDAFIAPHRAELHAHCYRMLGSLQDADDALQDTLLSAWRGFDGYSGRGTVRAWLYRIATNACLLTLAQRPRRFLAQEIRPAVAPGTHTEPPLLEVPWLEPYPDSPEASVAMRESVELAFVAALQHLPGTQRAVLLLAEVLGFSAAEIAEQLDTTVAAVNSALQRARASLAERVPKTSQQATLRELGDARQRELGERYIAAWGRGDVAALLAMLTDDARFTMPPIPSWFDGRDAIRRFMEDELFHFEWRLSPLRASGQLAFKCLQGPDFRVGALNVITLRGDLICELTGFLDPAVHARFDLTDR